MLSIRGIFNGKKIELTEAIPTKKRSKVIITFLEEDLGDESGELRNLSSKSEAFTFWNNAGENIYQDYLKK